MATALPYMFLLSTNVSYPMMVYRGAKSNFNLVSVKPRVSSLIYESNRIVSTKYGKFVDMDRIFIFNKIIVKALLSLTDGERSLRNIHSAFGKF